MEFVLLLCLGPRRFSGIAQDEEACAADATFEPTKWAKLPINAHGNKAIELAAYEYIKLLTAKRYPHVCMGINCTSMLGKKTTVLKHSSAWTPTWFRAAMAPCVISRTPTLLQLPTSMKQTPSNGSTLPTSALELPHGKNNN